MCAGSKGGVGKSILAMSVINHLLSKGQHPVLIETDTSNPDVYKAYGSAVDSHAISLDDRDGWINLVNLADSLSGRPIVINTAARGNQGIRDNAQVLTGSLNDLGRDLIALFMMNRSRDSVELLKEFREAVPEAKTYAVLNAYFGPQDRFSIYADSKQRQEVEKSAATLVYPEVADRVADEIYQRRMTIEKALADLPIGSRAELRRWQGEVAKMLGPVLSS